MLDSTDNVFGEGGASFTDIHFASLFYFFRVPIRPSEFKLTQISLFIGKGYSDRLSRQLLRPRSTHRNFCLFDWIFHEKGYRFNNIDTQSFYVIVLIHMTIILVLEFFKRIFMK